MSTWTGIFTGHTYEVLDKAEFSSTQINLPDNIRAPIQEWINCLPLDILHPYETNGPDLHVTVKYGLHTDNADDIEKLVIGYGPIPIELRNISLFKNENFDVLKIDVVSPKLMKLNKILSQAVDNTDSYPSYRPHVTLAYLNVGDGDKYMNRKDFFGTLFIAQELVFSDKDRVHTSLSLL